MDIRTRETIRSHTEQGGYIVVTRFTRRINGKLFRFTEKRFPQGVTEYHTEEREFGAFVPRHYLSNA